MRILSMDAIMPRGYNMVVAIIYEFVNFGLDDDDGSIACQAASSLDLACRHRSGVG